MTTRQTLKDFLLSIKSSATSISIPVDPGLDGVVAPGDDIGIEPNTGRPLLNLKTGEALVGDYLSYVTRKNEFPLAPGAHEAVSPHRGSALATAETTSAYDVFANSSVGVNAESLNRSNSMRFDASGYPLQSIIDKLGNDTAPSGNELLPSTVPADASSNEVVGQTQAVVASFASLKKYNKFSPTSSPSSFATDNSGNSISTDEFENTRHTRFQRGKGEYSLEVSEIAAEITQDELKNIARSMILKSAGWDDTIVPQDAKDPSTAFDKITSETLSNFPEFARDNLGVVDAFRARDSFGFPHNPDGSSFLEGKGTVLEKNYDEAVYTRTRGGTHTPDQKFGESPDSSNRIQSLQAGLSMIGLASLIDKKMIDIEGYIKDLQFNEDTVLRGPYYLGTSTRSNLSAKTRAVVRNFMFETGIYSYESCVAEGLYSCFGYKRSSTPTDNSISSFSIALKYGDLVKNISKDLGRPYYDSPMGLSQGFWRTVSESALRTIKRIRQSSQQADGTDYAACLLQMKDSLVVKVMNVFGAIGYHRLTLQGLSTPEIEAGAQPLNPFDVDGYPNAAGTRQMKSRDGELLNRLSLSWRNSALPSAFILPLEAMAASLDLNYLFDPDKGSNPIKGMLGTTLYDKTYVKSSYNSGIIPPVVAKALEDRLGAEYLPLYIRDLRTNEVMGFHGFLEGYSDSFGASYSDTRGFGRADPVYNYTSTNRSISFSFNLVATSKEDFDEMWFKINKLVTLVYPQYTKGRSVVESDIRTVVGSLSNQTITFEQPFSQLVGGTPVVRIRIGDILKSNYSRSNFGRLFGIGNDTFGSKSKITDSNPGLLETKYNEGADFISRARRSLNNKFFKSDLALAPFLLYAGSPMELTHLSALAEQSKMLEVFQPMTIGAVNALEQIASDLLVNGFVNPSLYLNRSSVLNRPRSETGVRATSIPFKTRAILKARSTPYVVTKEGKKRNLRLLRPVFVEVKSGEEGRTGWSYTVSIKDETLSGADQGQECQVSAADLYVDSGQIVDIASVPGILLLLGIVAQPSSLVSAAEAGLTRASNNLGPVDLPLTDVFGSTARTFISPESNPITRAFEERMGEGMAGVISSLSFTMLDQNTTWETDWNSRAPRMVKVSIGFKPIHDIAPGIDANGFNRAPVYNVGQIMHDTFGHPNSDGGNASRFFFKQGGAIAETAQPHNQSQKK